jgi:hypothetical protein
MSSLFRSSASSSEPVSFSEEELEAAGLRGEGVYCAHLLRLPHAYGF